MADPLTDPGAPVIEDLLGPDDTASWPEVNQAGGMLMVQLDCPIGAALDYLDSQAALLHQAVPDLARAVIDGTAIFSTTSRN